MFTSLILSGNVHNTPERKVSSSISAPLGMTKPYILNKILAYETAFDNVTYKYE